MTWLAPRTEGISVPVPSAESAPYWEGTRAGELRFQRCRACGAANFGPGIGCRACRSRDLVWERSGGVGTLYSWTVVWRPQLPTIEVPYAPAIVRLDEGHDLVSALIGLDHAAIAAGLRVEVEFHPVSDTITLPFFRPLDGTGS